MTFNYLVETNYDNLLNIAKIITGCSEKAHDLMNDTYLHLLKKDVNLKNDDEFVKFYRVCMKNLWLDSFKKRKIVTVDSSNVELVETDYSLITELELFKKGLPLHEKYLYELYFEDNLSTSVIAKEVGISTTYIVNMVVDIKKKLKSKKWN
jgi:RNA polymerase sigma factor (sigma-70 family)